jgi:hypothetical protein
MTENSKIFTGAKIVIYLSLGLKAAGEASIPERRAKNFKTINFFNFFLFYWVNSAPDPDPDLADQN